MSGELDLEYEFRPSPTSANWLSAPMTVTSDAVRPTGGATAAGVPQVSWTKPVTECTTPKECMDNKGFWYQDYGLFNQFYNQPEYCHEVPMSFYQEPETQKLMLMGGGAIAVATVVGYFLYKKMR